MSRRPGFPQPLGNAREGLDHPLDRADEQVDDGQHQKTEDDVTLRPDLAPRACGGGVPGPAADVRHGAHGAVRVLSTRPRCRT